MFEYIFLIVLALIIIPLVYLVSVKRKIKSPVVAMMIIGLFIATTGIFIGHNFPFYYTIFIMFGLSFALSVLLDKRVSGIAVTKDLHHEDVFVEEPKGKIGSHQFIEEESSATVEEEDIIIDKSTDDDLENWMSDTQKKKIRPEEGRDRSGE